MTIGLNVQTILSLLSGWGNLPSLISGLGQKIDALQADVDARFNSVDKALAQLQAEIGVPETGSFNPNPGDPTMSVLQMTVGDPQFPSDGRPRMLTFSEPGAPTDGAVTSSDPTIATMTLGTDRASWVIDLVPPVAPATGAGVVTFNYTGTSDPPDAGPVQVEPLVLTVVLPPVAETGQFNP